MTRDLSRFLLCAGLLTLGPGCGAPRPVDPPPETVRASQNEVILKEILAEGRDGDWLVVRGYHKGDKFVMKATRTPISHAAVLDAGRREVVESLADGVQVTPLEEFVNNCHHVLLVRPMWSDEDPAAGVRALEVARSHIGQKYDYLGTVGIDNKKRFYCSELVFLSYEEFFGEKQDTPRFIEPDQLYLWGTILYDSRPRNEW